jgi:hypothetical protein
MDRVQEADVIGMASHVRKELADGNTAGPRGMKRPGGLEKLLCFRKLNPGLGEGKVFSMITLQARLVVEGVDMGRSALHEKKDNPLGSRHEMGLPGKDTTRAPPTGLIRQERSQRQVAETERMALQHLAPGWEK